MTSNKLVSIIIPVYNAEKYLEKTLDSVLSQSYKDLEIILVNDGSTDNSINICKDYQNMDSRIKIINQENYGVSSARNKGFFYSNGYYISFIDADDIIEKDMIFHLVQLLENNECDVACCNVHVIEKDKTERIANNCKNNVIYESKDLLKKFLLGKVSHGCWDKLYKRHILEKVDFPLNTTGEDRYFCWDLYKNINKMIISPKIGYHYIRKTENSITSTKLSVKNISRIEEALSIKNDIILHYPNLYDEWEFYYFVELNNLYEKFIKQNAAKNADLKKYFVFISKEIETIKSHNNKYISF